LKNSFKVDLDNNLTLPLVDRLADYFRKKILSGELSRGDLLPRNDSIEGISHVTVIAAYKKLASEGLIRSVRAKGTIVSADVDQSSYAFVTISSTSVFNSCLLNAFQQNARYLGNNPQTFFVESSINTLEDAELAIPGAFRREVEEGRIRGVMVTMQDHYLGLLEWLKLKGIPIVGLLTSDPELHRVMKNKERIFLDSVNILRKKGSKNIHVFSTEALVGVDGESFYDKLNCLPGVFVDNRGWGNDGTSKDRCDLVASEIINNLDRMGRKSGLVITDDFLAIRVLIKLKERGIRVPEDINIVVITHDSQLLDLMPEVDLLLLDNKKLIKLGCQLMEEVISTNSDRTLFKVMDYKYRDGKKCNMEKYHEKSVY
jgi:DNA-binding LacI/PurR family transcriptional regulator